MQLKEKLDRPGAAPLAALRAGRERPLGRCSTSPAACVLFWLLPRLGGSAGFTLPFATAVILSAVQIHHFFVDGVIWKLETRACPRRCCQRERADRGPGSGAGSGRGRRPERAPRSRYESEDGSMRLIVLRACSLVFVAAGAGTPAGAGPHPALADERILLRTNRGDLVLALYPDVAPRHIEQILKLVRLGVYDSTCFHRVEPGFVVQLSNAPEPHDPSRPSSKAHPQAPGRALAVPHRAGVLLHGPRGRRSQQRRDVVLVPAGRAPHLDGKYTIFGELEWGMPLMAMVAREPRDEKNAPRESLIVESASVKTTEEIALMAKAGELQQPDPCRAPRPHPSKPKRARARQPASPRSPQRRSSSCSSAT